MAGKSVLKAVVIPPVSESLLHEDYRLACWWRVCGGPDVTALVWVHRILPSLLVPQGEKEVKEVCQTASF